MSMGTRWPRPVSLVGNDTRAYKPTRNIFAAAREWPKTSLDLGFWETSFTGISERPIRLAEEGPFRPRAGPSYYAAVTLVSPCHCLAIIPRHPVHPVNVIAPRINDLPEHQQQRYLERYRRYRRICSMPLFFWAIRDKSPVTAMCRGICTPRRAMQPIGSAVHRR